MPTPDRPEPRHAPMDQFAVSNGELLVGGERISVLVAQAGQTPFYAYDRALIRERVGALRQALPADIQLHYALKANPMPAVVGLLAGLVDGLDVASAGELRLALDAGAAPASVSFAGPGKREAELRQAVASRVLVNIESAREVGLLAAISEQLALPARVALRINPDFELKAAGMKMGGGAKPFGVDADQAPAVLQAIGQAGLQFEGFHIFAGSQNLQAAAIVEAQSAAFELVLRLADQAPAPLRSLNLGGGFGIPYFPGETRLELAPIADNLHRLAQAAAAQWPQTALVLELGRYLVGEAGVYVTRVLDRKLSRGQVFLVVDGGLHHHLAASGNFGQVVRKNYPVAIGNKMGAQATEIASVAGPLCTPLDLLADRMRLAAAEPGDWVVVFQSGAYGASASPQGFLGHPACVEMLV